MIIGKAVSAIVYNEYEKGIQCVGRIYASADGNKGIIVYIRDFLTGEIHKATLVKCSFLYEDDNIVVFTEKQKNQWGRITDSRVVKFHIKEDCLHREDGPAIETITLPDAPWKYSRFKESYYLNGIKIEKDDFFDSTTEDGKEKLIFKLEQFCS